MGGALPHKGTTHPRNEQTPNRSCRAAKNHLVEKEKLECHSASVEQERFFAGVLAILCASMLSSIGWIFEGEAIARLAPIPVICAAALLGGVCLLGFGVFTGSRSLKDVLPSITPAFVFFSILRSAIISLLFGYCLTLTSSTKAMFVNARARLLGCSCNARACNARARLLG